MIELMVVAVVIAILAAIAIPSYQQYVYKSRRSDAMAAMLNVQLAQEKFRANCPSYATSFGASNNCTAGTIKAGATSPDGYYTLALTGVSATGYTVTATAQGAQTGDTGCTALTMAVAAGSPSGDFGPDGCF